MRKVILSAAVLLILAVPALPDRNRVVNQDLTGNEGGGAIDTLARQKMNFFVLPGCVIVQKNDSWFMVKK